MKILKDIGILNDVTDISEIKRAILIKVAKYSYEGNILSHYESIPFELTNRLTPVFRCCVYKERTIFADRVRMGMGRLPIDERHENNDPAQIVYVIPPACEGCPIERFTVTNNCHSCLAQKCVKACRFGAITKTPHGAYIDSTKCKECGACMKACPYNAIVDTERPCKKSCPVSAIEIAETNNLAVIDEEKCINCGRCVVACPFGAIADVSQLSAVIAEILDPEVEIIAMVAPSVEGQYGPYSVKSLKAGIKDLGFDDCYEVSLGGDITAYREAEEVLERVAQGKKTTTSCCPAFFNLIDKHYPTIKDKVSTTVSPMVGTARYIKETHPNAKIVFVGPCIAKKNEVKSRYPKEIDYCLTFEEMGAMIYTKEIDFAKYEPEEEVASYYGKAFAKSGGVAAAVVQVCKEKNMEPPVAVLCNGVDECKKNLMTLKINRFQGDILEGMVCDGGCINGPGKARPLMELKRDYEKLLKATKNVEVIKTCDDTGISNVNMHRPGTHHA